MTENIRVATFPQMVNYDNLPPGRIVPFAMLAGPKNFESEAINTDQHGFRFTRNNTSLYKVEEIEKLSSVSFIVGGSTVFGVGSSSDSTTLPGFLSEQTKTPWLNLGVRGGISFQEYIHITRFIHRAKKVDSIVLFSGVNDTYINLLHSTSSEFDRRFEEQDSTLSFYRWERQALSLFLAKIYRASAEDLVSLPVSKMFLFPFQKKAGETPQHTPLSIDKRLERLADLVYRNFLLYSALSKQFGLKVVFVLQPFLEWTNKSLTIEEKNVMEYLFEMQEGSSWLETYELMKTAETYKSVLEIFRSTAHKTGIKFIDSNPFFSDKQTYFVDHVHLNDAGYKIAAQLIGREIK